MRCLACLLYSASPPGHLTSPSHLPNFPAVPSLLRTPPKLEASILQKSASSYVIRRMAGEVVMGFKHLTGLNISSHLSHINVLGTAASTVQLL